MEYVITRVKPYDELYHFGVKGMKWGVRRYQNPDGSLTAKGEAKVRKYKEKEKARVTKEYVRGNRRAEKRSERSKENYNKAVQKYGSNSAQASKKSNTYIEDRLNKHYKDEVYAREIKKIEKMKLSDIKAEKREVGKQVATTVLMDVGAVAAATALRVPFVYVMTTNTSAVKRNMRLKEEDRKSALADATTKTTNDYANLLKGK